MSVLIASRAPAFHLCQEQSSASNCSSYSCSQFSSEAIHNTAASVISPGMHQQQQVPQHLSCSLVGGPIPDKARQGRSNQRYASTGERLVAGCIPVRTVGTGAEGVEVLLISSRAGKGFCFPKGGWEDDETVELAAMRETVEEAGVRGQLEEPMIGKFPFQSGKPGAIETSVHQGRCIAHMYVLHVGEVLQVWPEAERQRIWVPLVEALQRCRHDWMRQALLTWIHRKGWPVPEAARSIATQLKMNDQVSIPAPLVPQTPQLEASACNGNGAVTSLESTCIQAPSGTLVTACSSSEAVAHVIEAVAMHATATYTTSKHTSAAENGSQLNSLPLQEAGACSHQQAVVSSVQVRQGNVHTQQTGHGPQASSQAAFASSNVDDSNHAVRIITSNPATVSGDRIPRHTGSALSFAYASANSISTTDVSECSDVNGDRLS